MNGYGYKLTRGEAPVAAREQIIKALTYQIHATRSSHKPERNADIYLMWQSGKTLKETAHTFGVTLERVRQINYKTARLLLKAASLELLKQARGLRKQAGV